MRLLSPEGLREATIHRIVQSHPSNQLMCGSMVSGSKRDRRVSQKGRMSHALAPVPAIVSMLQVPMIH